MHSEAVIRTRDLTRYYGLTVGVEALDLEITPGEIFGFLGPNGSGKTTTIRVLLDLIRPTRGEAILFGRPAGDHTVRTRIGYLPGELFLDGRMTGTQTLDFLADLAGKRIDVRARQTSLCERLGMTLRDLRRKVREYSRGMKQKLGLVAALQHAPELLILDEPTTGLDPLVREVVFDLMAEARGVGATVFHSSHVLSEVDRTCDRVGILRDGCLVALLSVEEARKASARSMVVDFGDDPPVEEIRATGVEVEKVDGRRLVLRVMGEPGPLLRILSSHPIQHFSFPESSLEDAFNSFYRNPVEAPGPEGPTEVGAAGSNSGTGQRSAP
jgi:ABC-2 type transport system ATP-binding protein